MKNNINSTPFSNDNQWNYGYVSFRLPKDPTNPGEALDFGKMLSEALEKVDRIAVEFQHFPAGKPNLGNSIDDEYVTIDFHAPVTSKDKEVRDVFEKLTGRARYVLMTPSEQDSFLNDKVLKKSVLERVSGHHEVATSINQNALRGEIERMEGYSIED